MTYKGKNIIITGGTSGIGLATAYKIANSGGKVYACSRHEYNFDNSNIFYHYLDVENYESCEKLVEDILNEDGKIDVLIANAGITKDGLTSKMQEESFDKVISTNLKGVFNIVKTVSRVMEKQGYGSIVTTSSIIGEVGNIGQVNYAASKAGVIGMSKTWAKEFSRKGAQIRVNSVAPGFIMTNMIESVPDSLLEKFKDKTLLKRLGKPEEVANVIAFIASDEASYITGAVIDVNGGMVL